MRLPVIEGVIRRRMLVNFRVDSDVIQSVLPAPFKPKLHKGYAVAGICLIRLEHVRPAGLPESIGLSSENAAHRIAVVWEDNGIAREGVYISRRDTTSQLSHLVGGRLFPGTHHMADFDVIDRDGEIQLSLRAHDGGTAVSLSGKEVDDLPASSIFASLAESSAFFEAGSLGYSPTAKDCCKLDGLRLETNGWRVRPLHVQHVESSYFDNRTVFPEGSITFDHALIMRDIPHRWHEEPQLTVEKISTGAQSL